MRPLSFGNCGQPQIASPWALSLRARLWHRRGVVAYGRRPKNPALHVEDPSAPSPSSGTEQTRQQAAATAASVGNTSHLPPLQHDDYELPAPGSKARPSLSGDPFLQQHTRETVAAQSAAGAPEPAAAPRGRRGRRRRQDAAGAEASSTGLQQQPGHYTDSEGEEGLLSSVDEEQYYETEAELSEGDEEGTGTGTGRAPGPTELVFRLERRGEGWGEELFPRITMEKRPIFSKSKHKCQHPDPWEARPAFACLVIRREGWVIRRFCGWGWVGPVMFTASLLKSGGSRVHGGGGSQPSIVSVLSSVPCVAPFTLEYNRAWRSAGRRSPALLWLRHTMPTLMLYCPLLISPPHGSLSPSWLQAGSLGYYLSSLPYPLPPTACPSTSNRRRACWSTT
jgi:hypothetical protein